MDDVRAASILRRLGRARVGDGTLVLPAGLSGDEALEAIRAVAATLPASVPPPASAPSRPRPASAPSAFPCIYIDGGSRGNPGPAGLGVVLIGPDGEIAERVHRSLGHATNNTAEYRALLAGLERARALGFTDHLTVYSDSELLVRQMQGRYQVKHPGLRPLYLAAREQVAGFRRVTIQHIPREMNGEADALANRGIDDGLRAETRRPAGTRREESL
jgi:ribonuclease HI